jgi:hypothetical protein
MGEVVKWGKKHQGASKREKCAMVFDVIIKTAAKARLAGKLYSTPHEDSLVVAQNIQSQPFCSPTATMSIFGNSPILPAAAFASMYIDPFTLYGSQMTNGFEQSNGSPAAVNDVLNGVLTTAGNSGTLTNDEFALLVVHANFLASTDSTWTAAQQSGAFGDSAMYVPPQSVFPGYNQNWIVWDLFVFAKSWWAWCGTACRQIGAADLITFLGGVKFGPEAAFYSAAAASAIAAITFM